jgi:hypothetical protein
VTGLLGNVTDFMYDPWLRVTWGRYSGRFQGQVPAELQVGLQLGALRLFLHAKHAMLSQAAPQPPHGMLRMCAVHFATHACEPLSQ